MKNFWETFNTWCNRQKKTSVAPGTKKGISGISSKKFNLFYKKLSTTIERSIGQSK
jgi:hypothetical protein